MDLRQVPKVYDQYQSLKVTNFRSSIFLVHLDRKETRELSLGICPLGLRTRIVQWVKWIFAEVLNLFIHRQKSISS